MYIAPLVTTSSIVDAVSAAMKPIVANITNPARNAVHASNNDIITASLQKQEMCVDQVINHVLNHIINQTGTFHQLNTCLLTILRFKDLQREN